MQRSKRQVLTSFSSGEKLSINCGCSRKFQFLVSLRTKMVTIDLVSVVAYKNEIINILENENLNRRIIFKYSKLHYFFLSYKFEFIILLLWILFLQKVSPIVQMYVHISKMWINISLHLNLNVLRKFMILCLVTLIAALGRMWPAVHGLDSPSLNDAILWWNV